MYVNYMDYSDDACLNMFTYWQYRRMEATLSGSRSSLQTSDGCSSPLGIAENQTFSDISLYPNPNTGVFTLEFYISNSTMINLRIIDMIGQEIFKEDSIEKIQGFFKKQIRIGDLPEGIYILQISTDQEKINHKIKIH